MTSTTVKLSKPLASMLAAEARTRKVPKSRIIREALERHFRAQILRSTNGSKRRPTWGEVNRHLAGCLKGGPADLSTNPKYMEGFGE